MYCGDSRVRIISKQPHQKSVGGLGWDGAHVTRARFSGARDGRWTGAVVVGYKGDGKPVKKYVYASTQREVVRKVEAEKKKLASDTESPEIQTVSQLVRTYSEQFCVGKSHWTVKDHNTIAKKLESYIGHVPLDELTGDKLARFFVNLETDGVSSRTRSRIYSVLKRALKYAVHLDLIQKSPLYLINAPSSESFKNRAMRGRQKSYRNL